MSLKEKLTDDLKDAMRAKDQVRLDTIRSVRAAITQREVETGGDLDDAQLIEIVRGLRKQRIEAVDQYEKGGRPELADKERREQGLLEAYLPAAPDAATMEAVVGDTIKELSASTMKDMGRVMQAAKAKLSGADGKELSAIVRRLLS